MTNFVRLIFGILAVLSLSCSKQKNTKRRLSGTWVIDRVDHTQTSGLSYSLDCSGKLFIERCDQSPCTYSLNITLQGPSFTGSRNESGICTVSANGNAFDLLAINPDGTTEAHDENTIELLTKTDLKFNDQTSSGTSFTYIFRKQ